MDKLKLLIAGGTGLIGTRLIELLNRDKYDIAVLSRSDHPGSDINYLKWDIDAQEIDSEVTNYPYIINLTGAGIADKNWTPSRKKVLIDSRVKSTALLRSTFQKSQHRIKGYVGASAIGYYGDRADEILNTDSPSKGNGFLVDCCRQWEEAHMTIKPLADHWSMVRIGIVLSTKGGAFAKMHPPMKLGVASYFGNGGQYYSWVHIDDICNILLYALEQDTGIFNGVSPDCKTNKEFMKAIKKGLDSSALVLPAPAFGLRLVFGEMADVILNSNHVVPDRLLANKYRYSFPKLASAANDIVKRGI